jgi:hypothetical protein
MITVGIPSYDHLSTETVISLVNLIYNAKQQLHFVFFQGLYIDHNRNMIVEKAIEAGSTHLMFIDADMQFPSDGIDKLLAHNKNIIGGYYNTRRGNSPIKFRENGKFITKEIPKEPFQAWTVPTGFMLIKLDCLNKLRKPYFATLTHSDGTMGEDVYFCKEANEQGLEVWCDPTIKIGHVGKYIY